MRPANREAYLREVKAAEDIADAVLKEDRDFTVEERAKTTAHLKMAGEIKARDEGQDALRKQIADLTDGAGLDEPDDDNSHGTGKSATRPSEFAPRAKRGQTLGQAYVGSPEYKALLDSVPGGRFNEKTPVQSRPFGVKSLITGVSDTSAGSLVVPEQLGMVEPFYQRPLTIRQLVTSGTTGTDTIEYVKLVSVTNAATSVAEATTAALPTQDGTTGVLINAAGGGYKPESGMVFARETTSVKTIAHWVPATKRSLSDAGQVKLLIDSFLLYGLEEELEDQMIGGSGVGELLLGVAATSGIQTQIAPAGAQTNLDTARMARRKVRIGGRSNPTGYAFNPIDWENIELMKDAQLRYLGSGPFQMTAPTLWGLPVVESEAVPAGTAYCADWTKAVLWDREQSSIQVTDSHADFFIRNLVVILAEMRAAFALLRPTAFVKMTLA